MLVKIVGYTLSLSIVYIIASMASMEGSSVNGNTSVSEADIVGSNPASLVLAFIDSSGIVR